MHGPLNVKFVKAFVLFYILQQLLFERTFHNHPRSNPTQNLSVSISSTSEIHTTSLLVLFVVLNK